MKSITLSKEDIQFIDNYLKYDIEYIDIRVEMVDHVASEIEETIKSGDRRGFYFIFKDYMVENKVKLINDDKKFRKLAGKKVLKVLVKNLVKPFALFVFIVSIILFNTWNNYDTNSILTQVPMYCFGLVIITFIVFTFGIRKKRYSSFERLSFFILTILFISQILLFRKSNILGKWMHLEQMTVPITLINSLYVSITSVFIYTIVQFRKEYNNRFVKTKLS